MLSMVAVLDMTFPFPLERLDHVVETVVLFVTPVGTVAPRPAAQAERGDRERAVAELDTRSGHRCPRLPTVFLSDAAVQLGGNEGSGQWSAGVAADVYQQYKVTLAYNGFFGNYTIGPTGAMNFNQGVPASLSDRGWVSLTFKTTF